MMIKPSLGLMLSMALLSACADATVFVWTDSQGGRHYSDQPQLNATQLHVEPDTTYYRVHKVVDGDTVQLDNGLKVRLLGVNSPEVAGRFKQAEAGGDVAKHWLTQRLQGLRVSLEQDAEAQDRYQRRLAYLLDEQHNNINIELVRNGLATVNVYPPNFKYLEALVAAQQQAEQEHKGLWGNPAYAAKSYQALTVDNYHGWQRIRGRITAVRHGRKHDYLQFSDTIAIQVPEACWQWFPDLSTYIGRTVEARGWVRKNRQHLHLTVRHPSALLLVD